MGIIHFFAEPGQSYTGSVVKIVSDFTIGYAYQVVKPFSFDPEDMQKRGPEIKAPESNRAIHNNVDSEMAPLYNGKSRNLDANNMGGR